MIDAHIRGIASRYPVLTPKILLFTTGTMQGGAKILILALGASLRRAAGRSPVSLYLALLALLVVTTVVLSISPPSLPFTSAGPDGPPQVRFLSRGSGYTLFLTNEGAVLSLRMPAAQGEGLDGVTAGPPPGGEAVIP